MIALEHESEVLLVHLVAILLLHRVDRVIQKMILAGPTAVVHADQVQQRGLARAGGTHDRDEIAFLNVHVDAAEHERLGGAVLEELLDVAEPDHRSAYSFSLSSLVTAAGSAWPRLAFITWPRKKFITVVLPLRYCSSCLGFAAITSSMIFAERAFIADLREPFALHDRFGRFARREHLRENFLGQLAADLSLRDQGHQTAQILRAHRRFFDFLALGLEQTGQIAHHPVRCRPRIAGRRGDFLEVIAHGARRRQYLRVVLAQPEGFDKARAPRRGKLRHLAADTRPATLR